MLTYQEHATMNKHTEIERAADTLRQSSAERGTDSRHNHLDERLREFQRREALGRASFQIAHELNNYLTVIMAGIDYIGLHITEEPLLAKMDQIQHAVARAGGLLQEILRFGRNEKAPDGTTCPRRVVLAAGPILRTLIGTGIDLELSLAEDLPPVRANPGDLEQVLINLVINARDAIQREGAIRIELDGVALPDPLSHSKGTIPAGEYVRLVVADNGVGMGHETMEHLFEPFYTTKDPGLGTGLGMAVVQNILEQTRGHITIWSKPRLGTRMEIYWPRV